MPFPFVIFSSSLFRTHSIMPQGSMNIYSQTIAMSPNFNVGLVLGF